MRFSRAHVVHEAGCTSAIVPRVACFACRGPTMFASMTATERASRGWWVQGSDVRGRIEWHRGTRRPETRGSPLGNATEDGRRVRWRYSAVRSPYAPFGYVEVSCGACRVGASACSRIP